MHEPETPLTSERPVELTIDSAIRPAARGTNPVGPAAVAPATPPAGAPNTPPAMPPAATADRLHALPLPITWDLFGSLRRQVPPPLSDTLFSIFDLAVCSTMLHEELPADGRPQRAVERWIRGFARCRREWLDVAYEAVGDAGLTPLRVEALALARGAALRVRWDAATRTDIEFVLGEEGRVLSEYAVAARQGRMLDHRRLRILSTRLDYCVTAALLAETDGCFAGLRTATPLLCAEARIAVVELRRLVEPECERRPRVRRTHRPRRAAARVQRAAATDT